MTVLYLDLGGGGEPVPDTGSQVAEDCSMVQKSILLLSMGEQGGEVGLPDKVVEAYYI